MYDKTCLSLLEQIYVNPGIHKRAIARNLKITMPSVDNAFKKISAMFVKQKSGNQIKYWVDYSKEKITPAITAVEYSRMEKLPAKVRVAVIEFLKALKEKPIIAVIFGSYALGDYRANSDIDLMLVFQKGAVSGDIERTAKDIGMKTNTVISPVYVSYDIFKKEFHDSSMEFYRNLKLNKIIVIGVEWWRQLEYEEA